MNLDTIIQADALDFAKSLPDCSVNCVVTSPPYYALRDYGVDGQIGLEDTPQAFIARLTDLFREIRRVLRDDGTCWINIGDSYSSGGNGPDGPAYLSGTGTQKARGLGKKTTPGIPPKNLLGMPWRLAFALQDDGWILRSDIIWHKVNPMPESVTDRPTKAHEYVFMFAKRGQYWYDQDAIREEISIDTHSRGPTPHVMNKTAEGHDGMRRANASFEFATWGKVSARNKRTVWSIPSEANPLAHFATFPQALITPMILAGCPDKVCSVCGMPWVRCVESEPSKRRNKGENFRGEGLLRNDPGIWHGRAGETLRLTTGWQPICSCNAPITSGVLCDPFMGSGTTAIVARRLGRHYIGSELNPEYVAMANKRLRDTDPYADKEVAPGLIQASLFSEVQP